MISNEKPVFWCASTVDKKVSNILKLLKNRGFTLQEYDNRSIPPGSIVLVFWTRLDLTATQGERADLKNLATESRLVSVLIEKLTLPSDIALHPVVDLINWRSSPRNTFYVDLENTLKAKIEKAPDPEPKGPKLRALRRLCTGTALFTIAGFLIAFLLNALALQNNLCSIGFSQPGISDWCGKHGLGDKPIKEERLAWENISAGSCDALKLHVEQFPTGAYHESASSMINAQRTIIEENWVLEEHRLPLYVTIDTENDVSGDREVAKQFAFKRGSKNAENLCKGFTVTSGYRLISATSEVHEWFCDTSRSGHYCAFEGEALCNLERLEKIEKHTCGTIKN